MWSVPPLVPRIILRLRLQVGSEASIFPNTSQQPGASYNSPRQFYPDGIRDVSKALFQLWLSSHVPAMAL